LKLPPILVGQSCRFALIAVLANGEASATGQTKTSLRSFFGSFGVAAATPYHEGVAWHRTGTPNSDSASLKCQLTLFWHFLVLAIYDLIPAKAFVESSH
jgi:hypothetical protein